MKRNGFTLRDLVTYGRQQGLEWWTCEQINRWERARRTIQMTPIGEGLTFTAASALPEATLLFLNAPVELRLNGVPAAAQKVERHGFGFNALVADLSAEASVAVTG